MFTASTVPAAASNTKRSTAAGSGDSSRQQPSPRGQWGAGKSGSSAGLPSGVNSFTSGTSGVPSPYNAQGAAAANLRSPRGKGASSSDDDVEEDVLDVEVIDPSDATLGQPAAENRQLSWQCGTCKYCMLAMDHRGNTLPISLDAWGQQIPLQCPRCLVTHTQWSVSSPFDAYGDHVNVKGMFANSYHARLQNPAVSPPPPPPLLPQNIAASSATSSGSASVSVPSGGATLLDNLPPILANIGLMSYRGGVARSTVAEQPVQRKQRTAYYCGLCNRRLLRMDHNGDLVPLDTNAGGEILPLTCPGCGVAHGDWPIRPS